MVFCLELHANAGLDNGNETEDDSTFQHLQVDTFVSTFSNLVFGNLVLVKIEKGEENSDIGHQTTHQLQT